MKKLMINNERGFTLIEMMIVLLVITIILLVALPNVTKHSSSINDKGCKALVQMVQGQVQAYYMDKQTYPSSLEELKTDDYLKGSNLVCSNGNPLSIDGKGNVIVTDSK
ncbi:competence type IV pilus major pilin ComGC [Lederbergia citrea]|uniref:ComG operon protein 3 n=1 Tax=Lederbergia citrea TaxID=2833581 RepID=A0A942Z4H9_9BACI|nr:competence type IV pilus major pilin ComGC [Lederbergia citrea]MBS4176352.1 prepilin-type N-terminal cleavage/methylation domain-containing protein [Lederbergia citrea]MBS4202913.1 prepilin-type N-terminal cleavage/methylation domain-containing protein [Lederbergia citrea]MBS4222420.1 prepilin-type N-terminal cleavage/methylation domain-containing protein [Lederbergia citrea]